MAEWVWVVGMLHILFLSFFFGFLAALIRVSLFFQSFPFDSSVSSSLTDSLMSSSHLFLGLPACLPVFAVELRPGFPLAAFFVYLSPLCEAILMPLSISTSFRSQSNMKY